MSPRPNFAITRPIDATPYEAGPADIVIGYPHLLDWVSVYQPNPVVEARYQEMKRDHKDTVKAQLDVIAQKVAGPAVLAEIGRNPSHKVTIFPYDFLPLNEQSDADRAVTEPTVIALTREMGAAWKANPANPPPNLVPQLDAMAKGVEITRLNHTYRATGAGTNVYVFYTAKRFDENQLMRADDGLLHELLHAARMGKGLLSKASVGGCFRNREEFLALVVQMVYRSERRLSVFDYTGKPIDPASFLDINLSPSVRELIGALRSQQPVFFSALAKVDGSFNPMRQLAAEAPAQKT